MKTQYDNQVRVVSLANLEAMCKRLSGMCHRFTVDSVSRSRVTVKYSNPNEYGTETPVYAVFPCYPGGFEPDNPNVVLDYLRVFGGTRLDKECGDQWQHFEQLRDMPVLWRSPETGEWHTEEEITRAKLVDAAKDATEKWSVRYLDIDSKEHETFVFAHTKEQAIAIARSAIKMTIKVLDALQCRFM